MAFRISVGTEGFDRVERILAVKSDALRNPKPALEAMADATEEHLERKFMGGGVDPKMQGSDSRWKNYSGEPKYGGFKAAVLGGQGATGIGRWNRGGQRAPWGPRERLGPSFAERSHPEHVRIVTRDSMTVGSSVPYAGDFHRGGRIQRWDKKAAPRRPIVTGNRDLLKAFTKTLQAHIDVQGATVAGRGRRGGLARLTGLAGRRRRI